jgi:type IV pilus assembly protein PilN
MIPINLLPHREERRREQRKRFAFLGVVTFAAGAIIVGAVHTYFSNRIEAQGDRNQFLEGEIATLDRQIEEIKKLKEQTQALLSRKKVVESLQSNRSETVRLLDQLVRQIPDGVYLKAVKQSGDRVNLIGYASSNARVSTLMRNLEASPWLESPSLVEIKATIVDKLPTNEFIVNVSLTREKVEAPDAGKASRKPEKG